MSAQYLRIPAHISSLMLGILLTVATVTVHSAEPGGRESLRALSDAFASVAEQASPAVVFIEAERSVTPRQMNPRQSPFSDPFQEDFFRRFFGDRLPQMQPRQNQPRTQRGHGSGFVVSADGFILTNHHVVANADTLTVHFQDGSKLPGRLVGSDEKSDLAVIQVEAEQPLPTLVKGHSDQLRVGEWVIAIGNPFGLSHSVTAGIVSAKGRSRVGIADYEDFIQTDAAINPGNSGGPLLNLDGEVIGINTAIFSRSGGYMGIGFAIPIDMARAIYAQLRDHGVVVRGYLGVGIQDMSAELAQSFGLESSNGVVITQVEEGSAAEQAGLREQDIVLSFQGQEVRDVARFRNAVAMIAPGSEVSLEIWRDGEHLSLRFPMGKRSEVIASSLGDENLLAQWGFSVRMSNEEESAEIGSDPRVIVGEVQEQSAAAHAGLRPGQVVLAVNRRRIQSMEDFSSAINTAHESGRPVRLVLRQGDWNIIAVLPSP